MDPADRAAAAGGRTEAAGCAPAASCVRRASVCYLYVTETIWPSIAVLRVFAL